jgi:hypothetical protein
MSAWELPMNTQTNSQPASTSLHVKTRVLPGHRVEVPTPGLPEGEPVDVFVVLEPEDKDRASARSAIDVIESLQGHRSFQNADEVDQYLNEERDAWAR